MSKTDKQATATVNDLQLRKDGIFIARANGSPLRIADPILVTAFGTNEFSSPPRMAYILVKFLNRDGKWKSETVPAEFLTSHRSDFITLLTKRGYVWPPTRKLWYEIIGALSAIKPKRDIKLTPVPGPCGEYFVLPGENYGAEGPTRKNIKVLRDDTVKLGEFRRSGTLDDWKRRVGRGCRYSSRGRLAVAANFAAPNLRGLGLNSFGFNFSGMTSSGKTLLLRWAACTSGLNSEGGPTTWDGTPTSFEQRALGHRDCIMLLDDLSYLEDPRAITKLVTFRLAGNRTKDRAGQYVRAHKLVETDYRVIALSSSEVPLWGEGDGVAGRRVRGQEVRMINIRADASNMQDIFDGERADNVVGQTVEDRRAYVEEQEEFASQYQGEAFRAYLARRAADSKAEAALKKYMADYVVAAPLPCAERWLARIQRLFAVIYAGAAQAIDYEILPWRKDETLKAIKACMDDAMDQLIAKAAGHDSSVTRLRSNQELLAEFRERLSDASFVRLQTVRKRQNLLTGKIKRAAGIIRPTTPGRCEYLLFADAMDKWFPNVSERRTLTKYLRRLKLIRRGRRPDTSTRQVFIAEFGKKVACYPVMHARVRRVAIDKCV